MKLSYELCANYVPRLSFECHLNINGSVDLPPRNLLDNVFRLTIYEVQNVDI